MTAEDLSKNTLRIDKLIRFTTAAGKIYGRKSAQKNPFQTIKKADNLGIKEKPLVRIRDLGFFFWS